VRAREIRAATGARGSGRRKGLDGHLEDRRTPEGKTGGSSRPRRVSVGVRLLSTLGAVAISKTKITSAGQLFFSAGAASNRSLRAGDCAGAHGALGISGSGWSLQGLVCRPSWAKWTGGRGRSGGHTPGRWGDGEDGWMLQRRGSARHGRWIPRCMERGWRPAGRSMGLGSLAMPMGTHSTEVRGGPPPPLTTGRACSALALDALSPGALECPGPRTGRVQAHSQRRAPRPRQRTRELLGSLGAKK